jgi:hypothetical protein
MISSLVINNLLLNNFSQNTHQVEFRLNELAYEIQNKKIKLPYQEQYKGWAIEIRDKKEASGIIFIAANKNKEILKKRIAVEK